MVVDVLLATVLSLVHERGASESVCGGERRER
jgi:hypothetical protein